jgi:hypothetical protein
VKHFEVILLGNELAGLVAGALLAKSGRRVLHLDTSPVRSAYRHRDLTFFRHLQLFSSWDASPAQKRAFFDLNLISDMSRRLVPLDPSFQVILPDHRVDVWRSEADLAQEVDREFPGAGLHTADVLGHIQECNERLDRLLDGRLVLVPEKWRERRDLARAVSENPPPHPSELFDGAPADHPLRSFAELPRRFLSYLDPDAENPVSFARAARKLKSGLFDLPGGIDELRDALTGVIRHFHGESHQDRVEEVQTSWGRVKSVRLAGAGVVLCEQVIAAVAAEKLGEALATTPPGRWQRLAAQIRTTRRVYTLNLAVHEAGIPEGMGPLGFLVRDPGRPLAEENLLLWSLRGGGELRALTLACLLPEERVRDRAYLRSVRDRVLDSIQSLLPFLSRHLAHVDVPWEDGESSGETVRPSGEMQEIYAWDGPSPLGIVALPLRTPLRNVVLANRQVLPALGLEGEFLVGAAAARLLHTAKEKKSWFD